MVYACLNEKYEIIPLRVKILISKYTSYSFLYYFSLKVALIGYPMILKLGTLPPEVVFVFVLCCVVFRRKNTVLLIYR